MGMREEDSLTTVILQHEGPALIAKWSKHLPLPSAVFQSSLEGLQYLTFILCPLFYLPELRGGPAVPYFHTLPSILSSRAPWRVCSTLFSYSALYSIFQSSVEGLQDLIFILCPLFYLPELRGGSAVPYFHTLLSILSSRAPWRACSTLFSYSALYSIFQSSVEGLQYLIFILCPLFYLPELRGGPAVPYFHTLLSILSSRAPWRACSTLFSYSALYSIFQSSVEGLQDLIFILCPLFYLPELRGGSAVPYFHTLLSILFCRAPWRVCSTLFSYSALYSIFQSSVEGLQYLIFILCSLFYLPELRGGPAVPYFHTLLSILFCRAPWRACRTLFSYSALYSILQSSVEGLQYLIFILCPLFYLPELRGGPAVPYFHTLPSILSSRAPWRVCSTLFSYSALYSIFQSSVEGLQDLIFILCPLFYLPELRGGPAVLDVPGAVYPAYPHLSVQGGGGAVAPAGAQPRHQRLHGHAGAALRRQDGWQPLQRQPTPHG